MPEQDHGLKVDLVSLAPVAPRERLHEQPSPIVSLNRAVAVAKRFEWGR